VLADPPEAACGPRVPDGVGLLGEAVAELVGLTLLVTDEVVEVLDVGADQPGQDRLLDEVVEVGFRGRLVEQVATERSGGMAPDVLLPMAGEPAMGS
jgi:hypothetical protein